MALAAGVLVIGVAGTGLVFHGYHLSRDEIQADFDSRIFRAGDLVAPVAPQWQPFADALQPAFMRHIAGGRGFVSAYLPVNAALRALVGLLLDPAWTSPLLAAFSVLAVFGIARRLWPERPDAAIVGAVLMATSSQVLVTAMTSYAMTAHLALNLLWLWLFLRDDRIGHGAAIGVGFFATGLHQLIFHPLFAAPFIERLRLKGRRRLALTYIFAYFAICLFWIVYPRLALHSAGLEPAVQLGAVSWFVIRGVSLVLSFDWVGSTGLMLKDLLRFVAWQNPLLLPLSCLAYGALRRDRGIARELLAGIVLTLIAMWGLMPYQGHGWGYRYLHGLIGNAALLAAYGWVAILPAPDSENAGAAWRPFIFFGVVASLVLLPVHAWQAHDFVMPYVKAHAAIGNASTDIVLVDESGMLFAQDLVQNDPFLRNRPKVLDLAWLDEKGLESLCRRFSVSIFDAPQGRSLGILPDPGLYRVTAARIRENRVELQRLHCGDDLLPRSGNAR